MAYLLSHAILHTVGNEEQTTRFSDVELEVDSETCLEFVGKHVRRLLRNPSAREATFSPDSNVYALVKAYQKSTLSFRDMSRRLCERLAEVMQGSDDIPPADILVAAFDNGGKSYLAIVKLNYGECYTHRVTAGDKGTENQIVKNTEMLPLSAGKVEEACLIPYDPMILRVIEKSHRVNGEELPYFSQLFLECEAEMSKKETAEVIREIADELNAKYWNDSLEMAAKVKCALIEEAEEIGEDEGLVLENVARRAFPEQEAAKEEFVALAKEAGLPYEVMLDKPFIQREFQVQRFKADNGVEIKCPAALFQDPDQVQLIVNPDGSVTITLRNLRAIG
jgi:hypothetical protein